MCKSCLRERERQNRRTLHPRPLSPLIPPSPPPLLLALSPPPVLLADADGNGKVGGGSGHHRDRHRWNKIYSSTGNRSSSSLRNFGDEEEEHEDIDYDKVDYEDLKPNIEEPTWLGPLERFDLGDGGSINPSINRYLRGFQREGVRINGARTNLFRV